MFIIKIFSYRQHKYNWFFKFTNVNYLCTIFESEYLCQFGSNLSFLPNKYLSSYHYYTHNTDCQNLYCKCTFWLHLICGLILHRSQCCSQRAVPSKGQPLAYKHHVSIWVVCRSFASNIRRASRKCCPSLFCRRFSDSTRSTRTGQRPPSVFPVSRLRPSTCPGSGLSRTGRDRSPWPQRSDCQKPPWQLCWTVTSGVPPSCQTDETVRHWPSCHPLGRKNTSRTGLRIRKDRTAQCNLST